MSRNGRLRAVVAFGRRDVSGTHVSRETPCRRMTMSDAARGMCGIQTALRCRTALTTSRDVMGRLRLSVVAGNDGGGSPVMFHVKHAELRTLVTIEPRGTEF